MKLNRTNHPNIPQISYLISNVLNAGLKCKTQAVLNSEVPCVMLRLPPAVSIILGRLWPRLMPLTALFGTRSPFEFLS